MKEIDIAVFGSCMGTQIDIGYKNIYLNQLSQRIKDELGININYDLNNLNHYYILDTVKKVISKKKYDFIIVQMRNLQFLKSSSLIIPQKQINKKMHIFLNPLIYGNNFRKMNNSFPGYNNPKMQFWLSINSKLGQILKLDRRVINKISSILSELFILSKNEKINLIVTGIIPCPANNIFFEKCEDLNNALLSSSGNYGLEYINIFNELNKNYDEYFFSDMFHLKAPAHKIFSDKIFEVIKAYEDKKQ